MQQEIIQNLPTKHYLTGVSVQVCISKRLGGSCNRDRNGMAMQSISDQELVNVLGVLDRQIFCSFCNLPQYFTLETEVSKEAFREWHNCLWHILKFPIAQTNKSWSGGYGHSSNQNPRHYWELFLSLPEMSEPGPELTVLGVRMPPPKPPLLKR